MNESGHIPQITTHIYDDKTAATKAAQRAGLEVCSGGDIRYRRDAGGVSCFYPAQMPRNTRRYVDDCGHFLQDDQDMIRDLGFVACLICLEEP